MKQVFKSMLLPQCIWKLSSFPTSGSHIYVHYQTLHVMFY